MREDPGDFEAITTACKDVHSPGDDNEGAREKDQVLPRDRFSGMIGKLIGKGTMRWYKKRLKKFIFSFGMRPVDFSSSPGMAAGRDGWETFI